MSLNRLNGHYFCSTLTWFLPIKDNVRSKVSAWDWGQSTKVRWHWALSLSSSPLSSSILHCYLSNVLSPCFLQVGFILSWGVLLPILLGGCRIFPKDSLFRRDPNYTLILFLQVLLPTICTMYGVDANNTLTQIFCLNYLVKTILNYLSQR